MHKGVGLDPGRLELLGLDDFVDRICGVRLDALAQGTGQRLQGRRLLRRQVPALSDGGDRFGGQRVTST